MRTFNLLILLIFSLSLQAQTAINIKDVLSLDVNCPLEQLSQKSENVISNEIPQTDNKFVSSPFEQKLNLPNTNIIKIVETPTPMYVSLGIANLAEYARQNKLTSEYKVKGFYLYQDDNSLWGIKNRERKILIPPTFDYIKNIILNKYFIATQGATDKYNVYDFTGKKIFSKEYEYIDIRDDSTNLIIVENGKSGSALINGIIVLPPKYDEIDKLGHSHFKIIKDKKEGVVNIEGKEILPVKYQNLQLLYTDDNSVKFTACSKSNHLLVIDERGNEKEYGIPFYKYRDYNFLTEGRYLYYNKKIIDLEKEVYLFCGEVLDKRKIEIYPTAPKLFYIRKGIKYYYFNVKGNIFSELSDSGIVSFDDGKAIIRTKTNEKDSNGRAIDAFGLKDDKLNWIIPPKYAHLKKSPAPNLFIAVKKDKSVGVINHEDKTVIPFIYSKINHNYKSNEYLAYSKEEFEIFDVLNEKGEKLYSGKGIFGGIRYEKNHYRTSLKHNRKSVILNTRYQQIYDDKYTNTGSFTDEAIWIEILEGGGQTYKIIDLKGQPYPLIIDGKMRDDFKKLKRIVYTPFFHLQFSNGDNFIYNINTKEAHPLNPEVNFIGNSFYRTMGLLEASKKFRKNQGLIDTFGREIIAPSLSSMYYVHGFSGAQLKTENEGKSQTFTRTGKELFTDYDGSTHLLYHYFAVKKEGKWGVMSEQNKQILPFIYSNISSKGKNKFKVKDAAGNVSFYNIQGKKVE